MLRMAPLRNLPVQLGPYLCYGVPELMTHSLGRPLLLEQHMTHNFRLKTLIVRHRPHRQRPDTSSGTDVNPNTTTWYINHIRQE